MEKRKGMVYRIAGVIALGLALGVAVSSFTPVRHPLVGTVAPDAELRLLSGDTVRLSDHRDNDVVILDFWATWCGPCRRGMPILDRVVGGFGDANVVLYGVNVGEESPIIQQFLGSTGLDITIALDQNMELSRTFIAESIPQTVIIDPQGRIQAVHVGVGPGTEKALQQDIAALLRGESLIPEAPPNS